MPNLPTYREDDHPGQDRCPNCGVLLYDGDGPTFNVWAITSGRHNPVTGGQDGAQSKYQCRRCGYAYVVTFADGSVFIG